MSRLTAEERETIILWDDEHDEASIYTHDTRMIRRLKGLAKQYPSVFVLEEKGPERAVTYRFPKELVSLRSPYDEERRQHQRERAPKDNIQSRFTQGNE